MVSCRPLVLVVRVITTVTPDIKVATGKDVELWLVDLAQLDSVLQFADKFEKDGGRLDLLVYNAAVAEWKYSKSVDGYELTYALSAVFMLHEWLSDLLTDLR